jgi:hypothetical protein
MFGISRSREATNGLPTPRNAVALKLQPGKGHTLPLTVTPSFLDTYSSIMSFPFLHFHHRQNQVPECDCYSCLLFVPHRQIQIENLPAPQRILILRLLNILDYI